MGDECSIVRRGKGTNIRVGGSSKMYCVYLELLGLQNLDRGFEASDPL